MDLKRLIIFTVALCFILTSVPAFAANSSAKTLFPDIQDHWAQGTVDTMATIKVFVGYPDGNFYPDRTLTRAEFLASLGRAVDMALSLQYPKNNVIAARFNDVKPGDWFWDDVKTALERGWVTKEDIGQAFRPNDPVLRKEMARIIATVTRQMAVQLPENDPELFPDVLQSNPYYSDIYAAVGAGILSGYPDGTFHPDGTLTRAEAATVILKTLQLDKPKSPYASDKYQGAWEASKVASMLIFGGWEEAFTQKALPLDLSGLRSFANEKAIKQYNAFLEFVKQQPDVDANSESVWQGEFYPTYVNNNVVVVSWSLSFNKKIGDKWYRQQTDPFTILVRRNENRNWMVEDLPVPIPLKDQVDRSMPAPSTSSHLITLSFQNESGVYYGNIWVGADKPVSEEETISALRNVFSTASGRIKILRILGSPVSETTYSSLVQQLETAQKAGDADLTVHQLVVSGTDNWFDFLKGDEASILTALWLDFNYNGGQNIVISLDGIPWTIMSDDPFWQKLQAIESSQTVKDNSVQLSQQLKTVIGKYKNKN